MSNRVLNDKQIKDVSLENNEPDSHDIEIVNSLPKSGEGYYYLLSKEKRKSVIPFSSVDIEYFDKLDVEDKAAFISMSRVQRDEHINYLRSADSYENNTSTKTDETRMTRKQGKSLIGQLTKNLRSLVKEKKKNAGGDGEGYLEKSTHTEIEKKYVGLKKVYIVAAVGVLCVVVMGSVLRGLGSNKKVKDERVNDFNSKNAITGTHLYSIPKDYSVLAADEKREKANRENSRNTENNDKKDKSIDKNRVGDRDHNSIEEKPYRRKEGYAEHYSKINKESELKKLKEEELLKAMASQIGFEIEKGSSGK